MLWQKIVSSWNDWDPLKRVIVGRCDNSVIPPERPPPLRRYRLTPRCAACGAASLRTRVARGSGASEPREDPRGPRRRRRPPDPAAVEPGHRHAGLPQRLHDDLHASRDILLTIGNEIMAAAQLAAAATIEYLAYWPSWRSTSSGIPTSSGPRPPRPRLTGRSYKHNYYDEKISLEGVSSVRLLRTSDHRGRADVGRRRRDAHGQDLFIQHA